MERRGLRGRVRRRPPRDERRGPGGRARVARRASTPRSARRSARAPSACWATRSACEATPVPELGLVGEPLPVRAGGGRRRARGGPDPGRRAARRGPAERQRRRGRARRSRSASAPSGILFLTDVPGVLARGLRSCPSIAADEADGCSTAARFEGGIVPKLRAAVTRRAARRPRPRSARRRCSREPLAARPRRPADLRARRT